MKTQRRMTSLILASIMLQAVMADPSITCFQDNLKCEMMNVISFPTMPVSCSRSAKVRFPPRIVCWEQRRHHAHVQA